MTVVVDQSRLVMNAFAAIFQNNLTTADLVTWKQYDGEFNPRNRLQTDEQVGPRYAITETTDGVKDLSSGVQDTVFGSERYVINKTFGSSMGWGDFAAIRDIGDARESEAIKNALNELFPNATFAIWLKLVNAGWASDVHDPDIDVDMSLAAASERARFLFTEIRSTS